MTDCGHGALIASGEARGLCPLCQRAEIERLLENQDPMQFEIERLRADNEDMKRTLSAPIPWLLERDLRAEIERLRAEIERLRADPDPGQRIWDDGYAAGKAASADEIERLRAFARYVADMDPSNPAPLFAKARAALELYPNEA